MTTTSATHRVSPTRARGEPMSRSKRTTVRREAIIAALRTGATRRAAAAAAEMHPASFHRWLAVDAVGGAPVWARSRR